MTSDVQWRQVMTSDDLWWQVMSSDCFLVVNRVSTWLCTLHLEVHKSSTWQLETALANPTPFPLNLANGYQVFGLTWGARVFVVASDIFLLICSWMIFLITLLVNSFDHSSAYWTKLSDWQGCHLGNVNPAKTLDVASSCKVSILLCFAWKCLL